LMDSATPSCGILQVTVSDLKAEVLGVFHLEADASEVAAVRRQLEVSRSIPNFEVHLVCHGRVLQNADLLCEFEKDGYVEITLLRSPQPCAVTGGLMGISWSGTFAAAVAADFCQSARPSHACP